MPEQDAIDQFIAMPKEERGKLFEQLAPEKQHKLIEEIGKRKKKAPDASEPEPMGLRDTVLNVFRPLSSGERGGIESKIGKYAGAAVEGVANTAMGITAGVGQMVLHPLSSIYASAQTAADALNQMFPDVGLNPQQKAAKEASLQRLKTQWEQIKDNPDYAIGNLAGSIEGGKIIGEFGGKMTGKLRDTANAARELPMRLATKTGPSFTREVVRDTIKKNEKIAGKNELAKDAAVDKNAENAAAHQEKVQTALHDTKGNEISHEQALKAKAEEIRTRDAFEAAKQKAEFEKQVSDARKAREDAIRLANEKTATLKARHDAQIAEHEKLSNSVTEINKSEPTAKAQIKKTYEDTKKQASANYDDLRVTIGDKKAPPYQPLDGEGHVLGEPLTYLDRIYQVGESMVSDWKNDPVLLKKAGQVLRNDTGEMTWSQLQDFRTVLNEALDTSLPADRFQAYMKMRDVVDEGMQAIADGHGKGPAQSAARSYYRQYAQAFLEPGSPIRQILKDPNTHGVFKRLRYNPNETSGLGAIRRYNPQLADSLQSGIDLMNEIRAPRGTSPLDIPRHPGAAPEPIPPKLQPEPTAPPQRLTAGSPEERAAQEVKAPERVPIPDRPPEVTPKLKPNEVVTPKSLIEAKRAHAIEWASSIRNSSQHLATVFVALDAARKVLSGRLFGFGTDVAARAGYAAAKDLWANYLESEKVLDAVGKITEKDVKEIMKLPEDQRQGFDQLVLHAQSRGTKLKPGVLGAMFGVTTPPITMGSKTKELKALRDAGHYTDGSSQ
jgi:hypothetical protein